MIREIKKFGSEELRVVSERVEKIDDEIRGILTDLVDTMKNANGVGLAAPQIGINKRIFVIEIEEGIIRKVINPEILELSDEIEMNDEGCLSVPGIYKGVKRHKKLKVKYLNENGEEIIEEAEGLLARAFQHENDHLDAVLFVDKISPIAKRMISKKLQLIKKEASKERNK